MIETVEELKIFFWLERPTIVEIMGYEYEEN